MTTTRSHCGTLSEWSSRNIVSMPTLWGLLKDVLPVLFARTAQKPFRTPTVAIA